MKVKHSEDILTTIGILWNVTEKFSRQVMLELSTQYMITEVQLYDLKEKYEDFVTDIYRGDVSEERISQKLEHMSNEHMRNIVVFVLEVSKPQFHVIERKKHISCMQVDEIKDEIRKKYSNKVENYFFDIILHMTDNDNEKENTLRVLDKYKDYCKKHYTRKGFSSIIRAGDSHSQVKYYNDVLKELKVRDKDDERGS